ncbi:embryonic polarity protein dorsal isoform X2 [Diachasma alloeum]|uniref:embryonic polarity protein dorsal isoform X2 n=1 Tax=Diachasma alloeum TaxID=454923 RepID=UPI0007382C76|nr:embryonic polarity protein dorsal isoform X2 [Diachasma alloeum]
MDQSFNANNDFNISDIIEVIETNDPGFVEGAASQQQQSLNMLSGGRVDAVRSVPVSNSGNTPYAEIVEQPAGKALRFRYECEGRSAGSIPGVNSMPENKTFPTIRIVGYKGRAVVVVSCVTMDPPYRPHPHNLVGKEGCKKGVCTIEVPVETMTVSFANLGIQCVKKRDIEEALNVREKIQVDPFRTGYEHKRQPTSIDLNAVRLCFQVFLEGPTPGKFKTPLKPIVSDPIYDKKAKSDLIISKLSHCSASVAGGTEVILLCEKIAKEDIQVRFFEEKDDKVVWEGLADFQPANVHKQFAIAFRTPTYRIQQVDQPVQVYIQLRRPSDGTASEPLPFQMLPLGADDPDSLKRKRKKFNTSPTTLVLRNLQAEAENQAGMMPQSMQYNFNLVKPEPVENLMDYTGALQPSGSSPMYAAAPTGPRSSMSPQNLQVPGGAGSPLYATAPTGAVSPMSPQNLHNFRADHSPGRTPSPMDLPYIVPIQPQTLTPQYAPSPGHVSPNLAPQLMYNNQPIVMNRLTPEQQNVSHQSPINNMQDQDNVSMLDLDSFDINQLGSLNSADLTVLPGGATLSETLYHSLSLSETQRAQPDSFTQLANNAIQELFPLNNMCPTTNNIMD